MSQYDMRPALKQIDRVVQGGPFRDDWTSLGAFEPPAWFKDAKFGIFTHWGLYSVPANSNEWYSRNMYIEGMPAYKHHIKTYGAQKNFGYKDFIPLFTAEHFDADAWIDLIVGAGARYYVPVAEHHDGFQLYKSDISHFNAYEMGPKRDVLGELKRASEQRTLTFCASSHRAEHWFFFGHGKSFDSDVAEPLTRGDFYWPAMPERENGDLQSRPYPTQEFLEDWLVRTCELIDRYEPRLLYFDWWIQHEAFRPCLKKLAAYYYNRGAQWGQQVAISYKHDAMMFGSGIVDVERGHFAAAKPYVWQTDTSIARNSWCYTDTLDYKSARELICVLIDTVSKNGTLLLNVGPTASGLFAARDVDILAAIGRWMDVNGRAIYGSRPWRTAEEGPTKETEGQFSEDEKAYTSEDFRFTVRGGYIYAFALHPAGDGRALIRSLADSADPNRPDFHSLIRSVRILGRSDAPKWTKSREGLLIESAPVKTDLPLVYEIEIL